LLFDGSGSAAVSVHRVDAPTRHAPRGTAGVGAALVAAVRAIGRFARLAFDAYVQRRREAITYGMLRQLDDRTLRDLGLDRSEITSIAAEASGRTSQERVHTLRDGHLLS